MQSAPPIDLVKEFRLRAWARRNHVAVEARQSSWHPVVLDEMARRDAELLTSARPRATAPAITMPALRFVPLEPGLRRFDEAHASVAAPNLLNVAESSTADATVVADAGGVDAVMPER